MEIIKSSEQKKRTCTNQFNINHYIYIYCNTKQIYM